MATTTFRIFLAISLWVGFSACGTHFEMPTDQASNVNHGQNTDDLPSTDVPNNNADDIIGGVTNSSPSLDVKFMTLPNGNKLSDISVSGTKLSPTRGSGNAFTSAVKANYQDLKKATQTDPNHKVQWTLMDLSSHKVIAKSLSSYKKLFGASSSKLYVASTLVDKQKGVLSDSQMQLMADMQVVSSNTAWVELQTQIGDGDANKGRERIYNFTQKMGYKIRAVFRGRGEACMAMN